MAREKLDFLIAFGEALCNMDNSVELLRIQTAADAALAEHGSHSASTNRDRAFDHVTSDVSFTLAEVVANELLTEESGSLALKSLYRFAIIFSPFFSAKPNPVKK